MRRVLVAALLFSTFFPMSLHAGQPKLKSAKVEPSMAARGDSLLLTVEFTGKTKDLKEVSLIVREYPHDFPRRYLQPIKKSKKNLWTLIEVVPYDAPAMSFHLDLTALDKNGKEIVTEGFEEQTSGRTGTIEFEVKE